MILMSLVYVLTINSVFDLYLYFSLIIIIILWLMVHRIVSLSPIEVWTSWGQYLCSLLFAAQCQEYSPKSWDIIKERERTWYIRRWAILRLRSSRSRHWKLKKKKNHCLKCINKHLSPRRRDLMYVEEDHPRV